MDYSYELIKLSQIKQITKKNAIKHFSELYRIFSFFYNLKIKCKKANFILVDCQEAIYWLKEVNFDKIKKIIDDLEFLELNKEIEFKDIEGNSLMKKLKGYFLYTKINFKNRK